MELQRPGVRCETLAAPWRLVEPWRVVELSQQLRKRAALPICGELPRPPERGGRPLLLLTWLLPRWLLTRWLLPWWLLQGGRQKVEVRQVVVLQVAVLRL